MKAVKKLNEREIELGLEGKTSWHNQYSDSAYVFVGEVIDSSATPLILSLHAPPPLGGLDYDLTEGDVLSVFSQ